MRLRMGIIGNGITCGVPGNQEQDSDGWECNDTFGVFNGLHDNLVWGAKTV